jgi:hypothetical protein
MTKTAFLLTLVVAALASMPAAHTQERLFVASFGSDTNSCIVSAPCRSFQHVHDTAPANSEIEVVDPAGYGPLTITHGISIQGHGFAGITQTSSTGAAITVSVTTSDPVNLNGLLIDGGGTGQYGIVIDSGPSVQILNSVVRHFLFGIIDFSSTSGSNLLIEDTIASDNRVTGFVVNPQGSGTAKATLNRITANNNQDGVATAGNNDTMIANSVISNNSSRGVDCEAGTVSLAKSVISGNTTGVFALSIVKSYGDNYINDNGTPVSGSLSPVTMQ